MEKLVSEKLTALSKISTHTYTHTQRLRVITGFSKPQRWDDGEVRQEISNLMIMLRFSFSALSVHIANENLRSIAYAQRQS